MVEPPTQRPCEMSMALCAILRAHFLGRARDKPWLPADRNCRCFSKALPRSENLQPGTRQQFGGDARDGADDGDIADDAHGRLAIGATEYFSATLQGDSDRLERSAHGYARSLMDRDSPAFQAEASEK